MNKNGQNNRLNLIEIEKSLNQVKEIFPVLNDTLLAQRELITKQIIDNLMNGYEYVDYLVNKGIDIFDSSNTFNIVELNHIVLMSKNKNSWLEYNSHIKATKEKFIKQFPFIIQRYRKKLLKYSKDKKIKETKKYKLAAGLFVYGVSQPQLFIEGNHRTGSLIMSYLLVREGNCPFVITIENAKAFFDPATLIKSSDKKKLLDRHYYLKKLKKKFAKFLEDNQENRFIIN